MGKPGTTRGGQLVTIGDVSCTRPRAYTHRPNRHTKQGTFEVKWTIDELLQKVEDDSDNEDETKIFKSPPITFDSDDQVLDYMGDRSVGVMMMNHWDPPPKAFQGCSSVKRKQRRSAILASCEIKQSICPSPH
jgi:hypothetical protein